MFPDCAHGFMTLEVTSVSFCVIDRCLKPDMGKKGKSKTQIKKRTLNPEFNEVRKLSRTRCHQIDFPIIN